MEQLLYWGVHNNLHSFRRTQTDAKDTSQHIDGLVQARPTNGILTCNGVIC